MVIITLGSIGLADYYFFLWLSEPSFYEKRFLKNSPENSEIWTLFNTANRQRRTANFVLKIKLFDFRQYYCFILRACKKHCNNVENSVLLKFSTRYLLVKVLDRKKITLYYDVWIFP